MRENWRYLTARGIEALIGLIFLLAGALKAWEPLDFIRLIGDYQIITSPLVIKVTAWLMIVIEIALGTALIVGYRRRLTVPATALLLFGFLITLGWAWYSGSTADCGCFGSWVKRTPAEAFAEDLAMLAATGLAWWLHRRESGLPARWRAASVAISIIAGLSVTALASNSARQSADPLQRMRATASQPNLLAGVETPGLSVSLTTGRRLVVLLDTGCEHCQASVPELNRLHRELQSIDIPLVALCTNQPGEIESFTNRFQAGFPIGQIRSDDFRRLFERGSPPRLLFIEEGGLLKIWDGVVPPVTAIRQIIQ